MILREPNAAKRIRLRLCVLAGSDYGSGSGPDVVLHKLLEIWKERHSLTLIVIQKRNPAISRLMQVSRVGGNHSMTEIKWRSYTSMIRRPDYDVVLDASDFVPIRIINRIFSRAPVVLMVQSNALRDTQLARRGVFSVLRYTTAQRVSIDLADSVVTASRLLKKSLVEAYGNSNKISVIPNGVDTTEFRKLDLPRGDFVLFVANLSAHFNLKGAGVLLRAFAILSREFDQLRLIIVGNDSPMLHRDIELLELGGKVNQVGIVDHKELLVWYNRAKVVVVPSLFDPDPLVAKEAMACGTALVVSDSVGSARSISQAKAGLVFPAGDQVALVRCLREIVKDDQYARELGENGTIYVSGSLTWNKVAVMYLELFEQLTGKQTADVET
jgi:glycosyltransferase involved in cell wall biosynthesis